VSCDVSVSESRIDLSTVFISNRAQLGSFVLSFDIFSRILKRIIIWPLLLVLAILYFDAVSCSCDVFSHNRTGLEHKIQYIHI